MKRRVNVSKKVMASAALTLLLIGCGKENANVAQVKLGHVVGGEKVEEGNLDFKSVVGLVKNGRVFCTGNLISPTEILTAAHCVSTMEYSSKKEFSDKAEKVQRAIRGESEGQSLTQDEFDQMDKEGQREVIKSHIYKIMERDNSEIKIHFGIPKPGGKAEGQDIVESVELSKLAGKLIYTGYFKHTDLANEEDNSLSYKISEDKAIIHLSEAITDIAPTPLISAEDQAKLMVMDARVTVAGFGRQIDPRMIQIVESDIQTLAFAKIFEKDPEKIAEIDKKLGQLVGMRAYFILLYNNSGDKNQVELKMAPHDNQDDYHLFVAPEEKVLKGSCYGDSGGPAFTRLENGEFRQIGIITSGTFCGVTTFVAPVNIDLEL